MQWIMFLAPWASFTVYTIVALTLRLGPLGIIEGVVLSLAILPFWRCICSRPVYLPYTGLLQRRGGPHPTFTVQTTRPLTDAPSLNGRGQLGFCSRVFLFPTPPSKHPLKPPRVEWRDSYFAPSPPPRQTCSCLMCPGFSV